jgi:uncharacterized protein YoxC
MTKEDVIARKRELRYAVAMGKMMKQGPTIDELTRRLEKIEREVSELKQKTNSLLMNKIAIEYD